MIDGHIIHDARVKQHLTQAELAEGVSNKETISLLEHNMITPRAKTINGILQRLGLTYEDVVANKENDADYALIDIEKLIGSKHYHAALPHLKSLNEQTFNNHTKLEVDFLQAFVNFKITKNMHQAIFEFNQTIIGDNQDMDDIFTILTLEQLGMIYFYQNRLTNAQFYLDQVRQLLKVSKLKKSNYWIKYIYRDLTEFYRKYPTFSNSHHFAKKIIAE